MFKEMLNVMLKKVRMAKIDVKALDTKIEV